MDSYSRNNWVIIYTFYITGINTATADYLLTYSMELLENHLVERLIKKFPAFYGTRKYITLLTSVLHLSLS